MLNAFCKPSRVTEKQKQIFDRKFMRASAAGFDGN
jgi:hypothetical protein